MAERPIGAGRRVRAQPRADIHRQRDPPLCVPWYRQVHQRPAQPAYVDPATAQAVVESTVPTPVLGGQTQPNQRADRPLGTQHGISQLKQRIRPQTQAVIEGTTKRAKIT